MAPSDDHVQVVVIQAVEEHVRFAAHDLELDSWVLASEQAEHCWKCTTAKILVQTDAGQLRFSFRLEMLR